MSDITTKAEKLEFLFDLSEQQQELISGAGHRDFDFDFDDDCDDDSDSKDFSFGGGNLPKFPFALKEKSC